MVMYGIVSLVYARATAAVGHPFCLSSMYSTRERREWRVLLAPPHH
jgi:hypothetical protein